MDRIAQTNLQLYNQLRGQGRGIDELKLVHRAYELSTTLYPGYFQGDGKPFVAHTVGVGSILAHLGSTAELIATGLLHNIYGNGDFGDGLMSAVTNARRRVVREAVGDEVEDLIFRFRDYRIMLHNIEEFDARLDQFDETERGLLLVDLADWLEKYVDLGVHYFGDNDWIVEPVAQIGERLIAIAGRLDQPKLAAMLSEAFAEAAMAGPAIPAVLRPPDGRPIMKLIVPRSCRRRFRLSLLDRFRSVSRRLSNGK